jgi:HAD superfamily hydrolase (TIGR01509 family)
MGTHDPFQQLEDQVGKALDRDILAPRRVARETELITRQPVRPGVRAYLDEAVRLELRRGLASSSSCEWVTRHLERLGLDRYFECVRAADDVLAAKPDPAVYLAVLQELNLSPGDVIAIEDSLNGVLAAKRAGLFCIAVPNDITRHQSLDEADLQLDSLDDMCLTELLEKVEQA